MSPVADNGELIRQGCVFVRAVAVVVAEPHAESREELVVGDVLRLSPNHAPRDLELALLGERSRERRHDPVVLAREERVDRRERDVLVRPHIAGNDSLGGRSHQGTHQVDRRCGRRVSSGVDPW